MTEHNTIVDLGKGNLDGRVNPTTPVLARLRSLNIFFDVCALRLAEKSFFFGGHDESRIAQNMTWWNVFCQLHSIKEFDSTIQERLMEV